MDTARPFIARTAKKAASTVGDNSKVTYRQGYAFVVVSVCVHKLGNDMYAHPHACL